jgi:solute carrier family 25 (mitochondrial oxoglutarate transporter), member 11
MVCVFNHQAAAGTVPEYTGALDVIRKTVAKEGVTSLWKGFTPYFLRLGPHTIFTFVFLEKLREIFGGGGKL